MRAPEAARRIDAAARDGGATVLGTGVNPGFLFDSLLAAASGVCWDITAIRGRRVVDVSDFGEAIHRRLGLGATLERFEAGRSAGAIAGHVGLPESIRMVCERFGVQLDGPVHEGFEPLVAATPAPTRYDYWAPSLDTTILAITSAVRLFGEHPDRWDLVREDPALIPHAFNEVVRMESPIQMFSLLLVEDHEVDGVLMPAGSRVIVVYASANRDERKCEDPERFDVLRRPTDHLAFGAGEHQCMGMPLARLECCRPLPSASSASSSGRASHS